MITIICPCGRKISTSLCRAKRKKYCSKRCFYLYRKRPKGLTYKIIKVNKGWIKEGQRLSKKTEFKEGQKAWNYKDGNNYKKIQIGKKSVKYHRYIMEKFLKRKLSSKEVIHHIDEDIHNNDISNLQILTNREHKKLHWKLRREKK